MDVAQSILVGPLPTVIQVPQWAALRKPVIRATIAGSVALDGAFSIATIHSSISQHGMNKSSVTARILCALCALVALNCPATMTAACQARAGGTTHDSVSQSVIIDTDIGGDIDDVYAVGLALQSPEVNILGITTEYVETTLEARLASRLLQDTVHPGIPVAAGIPADQTKKGSLSQARYAERWPSNKIYPDAADFILQQIQLHPGEITLIAIGPETNLGAAIDKDRATFRKLKRLVIMGGSVYRGYNPNNTYFVNQTPSLEYNIAMDPGASQKVFTSGVPLYVLPTDSTQIKLEELRRAEIFSAGTPMTDAITLLTEEWSHGLPATPTLNDAVAVAFVLKPALCPMTPMNLVVDAKGATRVGQGSPNAFVCLRSDSTDFFDFVMPRLLGDFVSKADY